MLTLKIRRYNATDCECDLCGAVPGYVWKVGAVTEIKRAQHFCDACQKIIDAPAESVQAGG